MTDNGGNARRYTGVLTGLTSLDISRFDIDDITVLTNLDADADDIDGRCRYGYYSCSCIPGNA